ncbi:HutD family protein [Pseudomonas sp. MS15a(2019)]|uniref:HutD/Ves family protein n=1 Tax=Pseudomonas sp. MS15a(2019) TaxID=2579938 RepID=UPI0015666949|nr:HutD family protein [Pseudomonas sp. MS15a(2019)]
MNLVEHLPAAAHRRMAWRNGLGTTLEIARDTDGTKADFGWRVSMADVSQSGDFSPFPGMTRIISVLEGAGMRLNVDGLCTPALGCWETFIFSGDSQVSCKLLDGPIRDFNLIYRSDRYQGELSWLRLDGTRQLGVVATTLLFCDQGSLCILGGHSPIRLERHDAARVALASSGQTLTLQGQAHLGLIQLRPLATPKTATSGCGTCPP